MLPAATRTEIWDVGGFSLDNLDPATVMSADDLVDAALAGLDRGEDVTLPSVEDKSLRDKYDGARLTLFQASQNGKAASRYAVHQVMQKERRPKPALLLTMSRSSPAQAGVDEPVPAPVVSMAAAIRCMSLAAQFEARSREPAPRPAQPTAHRQWLR